MTLCETGPDAIHDPKRYRDCRGSLSPSFNASDERRAELVVAYEREMGALTPGEASVAAYDRIYEKLAPIVGRAGVRAIYARSLELMKRDVPSLANVTIDEEPSTEAKPLAQALEAVTPEVAHAIAVRWLATFFWLLATFLGGGLTIQILRAVWAELDFDLKETK